MTHLCHSTHIIRVIQLLILHDLNISVTYVCRRPKLCRNNYAAVIELGSTIHLSIKPQAQQNLEYTRASEPCPCCVAPLFRLVLILFCTQQFIRINTFSCVFVCLQDFRTILYPLCKSCWCILVLIHIYIFTQLLNFNVGMLLNLDADFHIFKNL